MYEFILLAWCLFKLPLMTSRTARAKFHAFAQTAFLFFLNLVAEENTCTSQTLHSRANAIYTK